MRMHPLIQQSDLAAHQKRKALDNLLRATADELDVLDHVFDIPASWRFVGEIFRGAYVRIYDKGARCDDWNSLPSAGTRSSSHQSDGDQYHVDGPLVHTLLFGKFGNWTWLQLENHPIYDLVSLVGHGIDFVRYKRTGRNQGPYGSSPHAEHSNPLVISPAKPYVPIDRNSWVYKAARSPRIPGGSPYR